MPKRPELSDQDQQMRKDFGEGVKQLRARMKAKPEEFAAVTGVSLAHEYRIEQGERTADVLYLWKLVERYGLAAATTLLGVDEETLAQAVRSSHQEVASVHQMSMGAGAVQIGNVGAKSKIRTGR